MGKVLGSLVALAALAAAGPATAASVLFTTGATGSYVGSKTYTGSDGTQVKVTPFSINASGNIVGGQLGLWSNGLGIQNSSGDDSHTVDNSGWKDFLLLSFSSFVELGNATFTTNYNYNNGNCCVGDTDATVGRATPTGFAWNGDLSGLIGQNASVLNSMGLYLSNSSSTNSTQTRDINPSDLGGTLWLVGAAFDNRDGKIDGFKFKSVHYTRATPPPPPIPEPSVWVTMILGFGILGGTMRRRGRQALASA